MPDCVQLSEKAFDHGFMRTASSRILNQQEYPYTGEDPAVVAKLRFVAQTFAQLQEARHIADYNLTLALDIVDAVSQVRSAQEIFNTWPTIKGEQIAQAYLVSLLVKRV